MPKGKLIFLISSSETNTKPRFFTSALFDAMTGAVNPSTVYWFGGPRGMWHHYEDWPSPALPWSLRVDEHYWDRDSGFATRLVVTGVMETFFWHVVCLDDVLSLKIKLPSFIYIWRLKYIFLRASSLCGNALPLPLPFEILKSLGKRTEGGLMLLICS